MKTERRYKAKTPDTRSSLEAQGRCRTHPAYHACNTVALMLNRTIADNATQLQILRCQVAIFRTRHEGRYFGPLHA